MDTKLNSETRLPEVWPRLEAICRRLWDADSPAAVDLQAVIEEFKSEIRRAEQMISSMRKLHAELRDTVTKDLQRSFADEIRGLQFQLKTTQDRCAALEVDVTQKEERIEQLLKEIAAKEAVNLEFHEKFLASTAQQDEARAKKMEGFYQELQKKEEAIEAQWEARRAALEVEYKQRSEALKQKHEGLLGEIKSRAATLEEHYTKREQELELTQEHFRADREAWESARLAEQQALAKRSDSLTVQADNLAGEYKKKQLELQRIKESMQSELAEVVLQYQSRMRSSGA